jgi:hypothetical protein
MSVRSVYSESCAWRNVRRPRAGPNKSKGKACMLLRVASKEREAGKASAYRRKSRQLPASSSLAIVNNIGLIDFTELLENLQDVRKDPVNLCKHAMRRGTWMCHGQLGKMMPKSMRNERRPSLCTSSVHMCTRMVPFAELTSQVTEVPCLLTQQQKKSFLGTNLAKVLGIESPGQTSHKELVVIVGLHGHAKGSCLEDMHGQKWGHIHSNKNRTRSFAKIYTARTVVCSVSCE